MDDTEAKSKNGSPLTVDELIAKVTKYNPNANSNLIKKSYEFAKRAHSGQKRTSGEDFFMHPVNVTEILTDMQADSATICAALLHDVVEDTDISEEKLKKEFGEEIASLVAGVTKISSMHFDSKEDHRAENIRKVILATSKDVRVILIRLADRLHNMRTLKHLTPKQQQIIAQETLDIFAPIAYKLGMYKIKAELEDLSLRFLNPEVYQNLKKNVSMKKEEREKEVERIVKIIREVLDAKGLKYRIAGRAKHFYSIYKKMTKKHKKFEEIYDLAAVRILVPSVEDCYTVLGIIHSKWRPIPGRFHDYITTPKPNLYQSLHTDVMIDKKPTEIQIRTKEMHYSAEEGIAAHWRYKDTERDKKFDRQIAWLKQILSWKKDVSAREFIDSMKIDLFAYQIIVFTPKGDPITLPEGSTPIDFAYHVHTDIGNHCQRAKVNNQIVPLEYSLKSGDIIEIVTSANSKPSRNWLKLVKTTLARSEIRFALNIKGVSHEEHELEKNLENQIEVMDEKRKKDPLRISKCCGPKHGVPIVAFLTKDGRITVHSQDCMNTRNMDQTKVVGVRWIGEKKENVTKLILTVQDRVGILADLLSIIASKGLNVSSIFTKSSKQNVNVHLKLTHKNTADLDLALSEIRQMRDVIAVNKVNE